MRPAAPPSRPPLFPILLVCAVTCGLALGIGSRYFANKNGGTGIFDVIVDPQSLFPYAPDRLNILVGGLDENYTRKDIDFTKGSRTDTLFLVSLDLKTEKGYLLSIPRDMRVPIAGTHYRGKINGAYATGGVVRAMQTVADFLDVPVHNFVILKIDATKKLVDAVGGVDLNVEKDMDYDDNWGHLHIHFKKGMQHLDGDQAVAYIRFRHDREGDFGRIRRQQQLLHVIAQKMKTPMVLIRLPGIVDQFRQSVFTNLTTEQIMALGRMFKSVSPSQIVTSYVPGLDQRIDGVQYLVPDEPKKKAVVDWLIRGDVDGEIPLVRVAVMDGCGIPDAADAVCDRLRVLGFQVARGGDADRSDYTTSQIIDYDRMKGSGSLVASKLGLSSSPLLQPDPQADAAVELIVGQDLANATLAARQ